MFKLPKKPKNKPAQELLVERDLCANLKEASSYIYAGQVFANEQRVEKPGQMLPLTVSLRVKKKGFVGRGGEKLSKAVDFLQLDKAFQNTCVLDVGASTGGFTDCALKLGASKVVAVDIGFNQLDWSLRTNSRVQSIEQTDIREWDSSSFGPFDWILADVSFSSLEALASTLMKLASPQTRFLILVKPQFELSMKEVPSGGVVEDEALWDKAVSQVRTAFEKLGASHFQVVKSALKGRSGNQEFFIYFYL